MGPGPGGGTWWPQLFADDGRCHPAISLYSTTAVDTQNLRAMVKKEVAIVSPVASRVKRLSGWLGLASAQDDAPADTSPPLKRSRETSAALKSVDTAAALKTEPPAKQPRRAAAKPKAAAAPAADAPHAPAPAPARSPRRVSLDAAGLTPYERQRELLIKRNRERMAELQLPSLAAGIAAAAPAQRSTVRGLKTGRAARVKPPLGPPRKSARLEGSAPADALAAGVDFERRDGSVVLRGGEAARLAAGPAGGHGGRVWAPPSFPAPFSSLNGSPSSDAAFLATLRGASAPASAPASPPAPGAKGKGRSPKAAPAAAAQLPPALAQLKALRLTASDVAKVVKKAVTHLEFLPRSDRVVVAAADKEGSVALWDVSASAAQGPPPQGADGGADGGGDGGGGDDSGEGGGAEDGVLLTRQHGQYVSGLRWTRESVPRLLTSSYDGTICCLDVTAGQWLQLYSGGDDVSDTLSAFDCSPSGDSAWIGTGKGDLRAIDLRSGKEAVKPFAAHDRKLNCVSCDPAGGPLLATASGDCTVALWDVRKLGKAPLFRMAHGKSCQAAYLAPCGPARVLATSYDDTLRVWAVGGAAPSAAQLTIKHDNQTGRWVSPFRAVWSAAADAVVCGSMKRATEIISAETGKMEAVYVSELATAIAPRHACHPTLPVVAAGTGSGRIHIWHAAAL